MTLPPAAAELLRVCVMLLAILALALLDVRINAKRCKR